MSIDIDDLWDLFYDEFVVSKNWVLDKSFFDDVFDSYQLYSKMRKTSVFYFDSAEVKNTEKVSCFRTLKQIFSFPEFPELVQFKHSTKGPLVPYSADQTLNYSDNSLIASSPIYSQNSTETGNQESQNDNSREPIDVLASTQPIPEVPGAPEILNKSLNVIFLKNGQSNEINPQLALNRQPNLNVYQDLNDCIVGGLFDSKGLDFLNFAWIKGEPQAVTSKQLSELQSKAKSRGYELTLSDPETIDETISQFNYYLKKWSGEIASHLKFLFPYDAPMDICVSVASKFDSLYPKTSVCWQLLMEKFPEFKTNYSCFEVMFGRRIHERFRNRARTLRTLKLFPSTPRSHKIEFNEAKDKALVTLKPSKSKKIKERSSNTTDNQQLDDSGLPATVESEYEEDSDEEDHPLESYFDYKFAMKVATSKIGATEYTAPLVFITYLTQKNDLIIQAKEKKEILQKSAEAKQQIKEFRKQTRATKDQEVGLPTKKKRKRAKKI